jgi:hypothetical protein
VFVAQRGQQAQVGRPQHAARRQRHAAGARDEAGVPAAPAVRRSTTRSVSIVKSGPRRTSTAAVVKSLVFEAGCSGRSGASARRGAPPSARETTRPMRAPRSTGALSSGAIAATSVGSPTRASAEVPSAGRPDSLRATPTGATLTPALSRARVRAQAVRDRRAVFCVAIGCGSLRGNGVARSIFHAPSATMPG